MTIKEIHKEFDILLDKVDSNSFPEFLPSEKDSFLNKAILSFVKTRYSRNNIYKKGFEANQKRTEDLKTLVITKESTFSQVEDIGKSKLYKVSLDETSLEFKYLFYISNITKLKKEGCSSNFLFGALVEHDDLGVILKDPFNKPDWDNPIIYFEDNSIYCVTGTGILEGFRLTYLKYPDEVCLGTYKNKPEVQCDLPEHTHSEIINLAVEIAIESISSPRVNTIGLVKNQQE